MSYGYGGRANPYDQRGGAPGGGGGGGGYGQQQAYDPPQGGGYESQPYGAQPPTYAGNTRFGAQPTMGRDNYGAGANVEMEPLAPNGGSFARQQDPNAILNECREIDQGIDAIERNLERLKFLQQRSLDDPDSSVTSGTSKQLDAMSSETMTLYRNFAGRIKAIKQRPESGTTMNATQVGRIDRKLKTAINQYQNIDKDFRKKLLDQMARQYRIVNPNADEAEARAAVADTENQQVFAQALMQGNRSGQAQQALRAVESRHVAIQKIQRDMEELAQLFIDMDTLVVQQEAAVTLIEQKGEEVVDNMQGGNEQLTTGIKSARARNRKKWWCLLICVIIIIIVVIVVVIYVKVINPPKSKRDLSIVNAAFLQVRNTVAGQPWTPRGRSVLPRTSWRAGLE